MSKKEWRRVPQLSRKGYLLAGLPCIIVIWLCALVPALNPLRLDGMLSDLSLLRDLATLQLARPFLGLVVTIFLGALYLLQTGGFLLALPKGKLAVRFKWVLFSISALFMLVFLAITLLMFASDRTMLGGVLSFLANVTLLFLALFYTPAAPTRTKTMKRLHGALASLVMSALVVGSVALWHSPVNGVLFQPNIPLPPDPGQQTGQDDDNPNSSSTPRPDPNRKPGVFTFILAGMDVSLHTDTLMVATLDSVNHTLHIVTIPRDTMVDVSHRQSKYQPVKKINGAYMSAFDPITSTPDNETKKINGINGLKTELRSILGFMPDYHFIVSLNSFVELVDAVGGVNFDVPQRMRYSDPSQNLYIDLQKGYQKLDGKKAIQLVRFRGNYAEGDLKRVRVTQDFLKALFDQASGSLSLNTINKILKIAENEKNINTNIASNDLMWFFNEIQQIKSDDITFDTMPYKEVHYKGGDYVHVKPDELLELINEKLNPYVKPITEDNLKLSFLSD